MNPLTLRMLTDLEDDVELIKQFAVQVNAFLDAAQNTECCGVLEGLRWRWWGLAAGLARGLRGLVMG